MHVFRWPTCLYLSLSVLSIQLEEGSIHELLLCLLPPVYGGEEPLVGIHARGDGLNLRVSRQLPLKQLLFFVDLDNLITNLYQPLLEAAAEMNYNITELAEIPYSRKYWRKLNLAVEPKIAIARILVDLNLAVRYGIAIRIYASRKLWWILIWRL